MGRLEDSVRPLEADRDNCKLCDDLEPDKGFPDPAAFGLPLILRGCCGPCILGLVADFAKVTKDSAIHAGYRDA